MCWQGVPEAPRCGFSNAVVQIMRMHDVQFKSYNVLADEELRYRGDGWITTLVVVLLVFSPCQARFGPLKSLYSSNNL